MYQTLLGCPRKLVTIGSKLVCNLLMALTTYLLYMGVIIHFLITGWWFQTHLKNISQIGNLPQVGVKIKNI